MLLANLLLLSQLAISVSSRLFTNHFALRLSKGVKPEDIASRHGLTHLGQIGSLKSYHLFEHPSVRKRSVMPHLSHSETLRNEPFVEAVWQQQEKKRYKRIIQSRFPDPLFSKQWYLNGGAEGGGDMNVEPAWTKGYTGKGVVVTILDDGIQTNHPDLKDNYDPAASYDINDDDWDPMPRDDGDNKHGTRCAGEVAAKADNSVCGVGIAYNASIGGVRMLDGVVNDAVEARALSLNPDHIDIYSASWGPEDDGRTVDGPGPLATRAFINGVNNGRRGRGSIYIWASGNGGRHTDSCNCDGYTNSIYTISISSATQAGLKPWYLEECSSTMATTYSSGTLGRDKSVASVDMDSRLRESHLCTTEHTGTSASAPIAAGMVALALEANPTMTWRDVQHLIVQSANPGPLLKEPGWITNGANMKVSHKFGFGLLDGGRMVTMAEQWTTVPIQRVCNTPVVIEEKSFDDGIEVSLNVTDCKDLRFLEHVQCRVSASSIPRGGLKIVLTSPSGTESTLLHPRAADTQASAFEDWPFLTVHFWGENPIGIWTLNLTRSTSRKASTGALHKWQLILFGTLENPVKLIPSDMQPFHRHPDISNEVDIDWNATSAKRGLTLVGCNKECDSTGCYGPGANHCNACRKYWLEGECVSECPKEGYYSLGRECRRCHADCLSCSGPGPESCISCAPALYFVDDLALCLPDCPNTYYRDPIRKLCLSCHDNCASCQDSPMRCSSCTHPFMLYRGNCVITCPPNSFKDSHSRCADCHKSCVECHGPNSTDCVEGPVPIPCGTDCASCPSGMNILNDTCVYHCGPGYYAMDGRCLECWFGCKACSGGSPGDCLSCNSGWMMGNGQCHQHCPKDMFFAPTGCQKCHHSCSTCNGGGGYSCTGCSAGRYMSSAGVCLSCGDGCSECSGTNCTACLGGSLPQNGRCSYYAINNESKVSDDLEYNSEVGLQIGTYLQLIKDGHQSFNTSPHFILMIIVVTASVALSILAIIIFTKAKGSWNRNPSYIVDTDHASMSRKSSSKPFVTIS